MDLGSLGLAFVPRYLASNPMSMPITNHERIESTRIDRKFCSITGIDDLIDRIILGTGLGLDRYWHRFDRRPIRNSPEDT